MGTSLIASQGTLDTANVYITTCLTRHSPYPKVGTFLPASQGIVHTPSGYIAHCLARHTSHPQVGALLTLPRKAFSKPQVCTTVMVSHRITHTSTGKIWSSLALTDLQGLHHLLSSNGTHYHKQLCSIDSNRPAPYFQWGTH